eukprot:8765462-Karenia_brevis.AAC.1
MTIDSLKGNHWNFVFKSELFMLGDAVDARGATETSMQHRMLKASGAFACKRKCLTDKRTSIKKRLERFYSLVGSSFLHLAGTWHLTKTTASQIRAWENRKLQQVMQLNTRKPGHDRAKHMRETGKLITATLKRLKFDRLHVRVMRNIYWAAWSAFHADSFGLGERLWPQ